MHYTTLRDTSIKVSAIGLGCWEFRAESYWGDQDDKDSIATVRAALDAGVNLFDTAEAYGNGRSEEVLGKALAGRRNEAVIASKVSPQHLAAPDVVASCEASLRRLQTDYIDLYQIHWPSRTVPLEETIGALDALKRQGKIRTYGVCNFGVQDQADLLRLTTVPTNQLPYNLLWRVVEREILPACFANGMGVLCYSALAQGLLTGRYATADDVPPGLTFPRWFAATRPAALHGEAGCEAEVFAAVAGVRAIARELGKPMVQTALAWLLQQQNMASLLVGARSPRELAENLPAVDLRLSADFMRRLNEATDPVKNRLGDNPDMRRAQSRIR